MSDREDESIYQPKFASSFIFSHPKLFTCFDNSLELEVEEVPTKDKFPKYIDVEEKEINEIQVEHILKQESDLNEAKLVLEDDWSIVLQKCICKKLLDLNSNNFHISSI